ncbi:hypothetical protein ACLB2K_067323 [Fragaria x ananassa]
MVRVFKDKGKVVEETVGAVLRFLEENQRVAVSKVEKRLLSPLSRIGNKLELLLENSALGQMVTIIVHSTNSKGREGTNVKLVCAGRATSRMRKENGARPDSLTRRMRAPASPDEEIFPSLLF